ncbi:unnamed protein product [Ectocarpus sp. 4 AP-2014]
MTATKLLFFSYATATHHHYHHPLSPVSLPLFAFVPRSALCFVVVRFCIPPSFEDDMPPSLSHPSPRGSATGFSFAQVARLPTGMPRFPVHLCSALAQML